MLCWLAIIIMSSTSISESIFALFLQKKWIDLFSIQVEYIHENEQTIDNNRLGNVESKFKVFPSIIRIQITVAERVWQEVMH